MVKVNEAFQEALVGAKMLASVERLQAVGRLRSSAAWVLPPSAATSRASAGMECTHTAGLAQLEEETLGQDARSAGQAMLAVSGPKSRSAQQTAWRQSAVRADLHLGHGASWSTAFVLLPRLS